MTTNTPLVSIGLPLYNGVDYLADTLSSLTSQSYSNLEIIIVDNASTDGSIDICQTFALRDKRVRIHRNNENLGSARNYNLAVALASGKYFKWVAHEDPIAPTAIKRCVEVLEKRPEVIMAYPRTIFIDGSGDLIEYHSDGFHLASSKPHVRLRHSLYSSAWCHPVFGLVRRHILNQTGLIGDYPSSNKVLLSEFALRGQCYEVPEYLAYRRLHTKNPPKLNRTDEEMTARFNSHARRVFMAPRMRQLIELNQAIRRSNLNATDELLCRFELARFYLSLGRAQSALRNLRQMARRTSKLANQV